MNSPSALLELLSLRDVVDILAVALSLYYVFMLIRGTRAVQILMGLLVLIGTYYLAQALGLKALETLLDFSFGVLPIAIIVLFQNQIRRALATVGTNPLYSLTPHSSGESDYQEVVLSTTTLASRRIGALVVIERLQGLRDYIENGILLEAAVSVDLLISIFNPGTPLHDGAVVVSEGRIASAACFLPLSTNPELSTKLGTRHRAALGISEETDAIAVVVSEETGEVAVAIEGQLIEDLDPDDLRRTLLRYLVVQEDQPRSRA